MLVGLTNTLQCNEREAIRIALYEASRSTEEAHKAAFKYATSEATDKAHQGRSSLKQWKLPKSEKEQAAQAAKKLGITDSEFMRLGVIWMQRGIRYDNIKQLTNSKLIPLDTEAKKWSRENPGSEAQGRTPHPGVAKLKEAAKASFEEAGEIYSQRNKEMWATRKEYLMENGFNLPQDEDERQADFRSLDALIEIQEADNFNRIVQEEIEKLRLSEREAFEFKWKELIPDLTKRELDWLWEQELVEAKELAQCEEQIDELMEEIDALCRELRDLVTPEEREEQERKRQEANERFRRKLARRSRRWKQDPFEARLRKRLDDIFDARD